MYRRSWTSLVRKEPATVIATLHHSWALSDESYKPFSRKVHMYTKSYVQYQGTHRPTRGEGREFLAQDDGVAMVH